MDWHGCGMLGHLENNRWLWRKAQVPENKGAGQVKASLYSPIDSSIHVSEIDRTKASKHIQTPTNRGNTLSCVSSKGRWAEILSLRSTSDSLVYNTSKHTNKHLYLSHRYREYKVRSAKYDGRGTTGKGQKFLEEGAISTARKMRNGFSEVMLL